jgi:hypothetical protein
VDISAGEKEARIAVWARAGLETPDNHGSPMALVNQDAIDEQQLTEVITDSWRPQAPRRLLARVDRGEET